MTGRGTEGAGVIESEGSKRRTRTVDHLSTTVTTQNILNHVCLKSHLGREKG